MKRASKFAITVGAISVSALAGSTFSYAAFNDFGTGLEPAPSGINLFGESYGPEGFGDSYDLIAAVGDGGSYGYVRAADLRGPEFASPEEAITWQNAYLEEYREIPLYAVDGRTIIGSFTLETRIEVFAEDSH